MVRARACIRAAPDRVAGSAGAGNGTFQPGTLHAPRRVARRARFYPRADLARPANERRPVVTTPFARTEIARPLADAVVRCCILALFLVRAAARLAVRLALPPLPGRSRGASRGHGTSARYDAIPPIDDRTGFHRTRLRPSPGSTPEAPLRCAVVAADRVDALPEAAWPITYHSRKIRSPERRTRLRRLRDRSATTFSYCRAAVVESPRCSLPADPHEARN